MTYSINPNVSKLIQVTTAKKDDRPISTQEDGITPDVYAAIHRSESKQAKQLQDILARPPFRVSRLFGSQSIALVHSYSADTSTFTLRSVAVST